MNDMTIMTLRSADCTYPPKRQIQLKSYSPVPSSTMESKCQVTLKYIFKSILFLSLFIVFCAFYVPGVIKNFSKQTSTFHVRNEAVQRFEMPSVLICYNMGYKVSKAIEYNIASPWDFMNQESFVGDKPPWQVYQDVIYKLNEDFTIEIEFYDHEDDTKYSKEIKVGANEIQGKDEEYFVEVLEVPTLYQVIFAKYVYVHSFTNHLIQGSCIVMNVNYTVKKGEYIGLTVKSVKKENPESGISVFFTSQSEWDRIVFSKWIEADPINKWIYFTNTEKQFLMLELEEFIYKKGNENCNGGCPKNLCLTWDKIRDKKCTVNCIPYLLKSWYPDLEICATIKDHFCQTTFYNRMELVEVGDQKNDSCFPKTVNKYRGRTTYTFNNEPTYNVSALRFYFAFESMSKKINEEHVIYDVFGMIGSLGGSLSLFIGFSFFDYGCKMVNKLFNHCKRAE